MAEAGKLGRRRDLLVSLKVSPALRHWPSALLRGKNRLFPI